MTATIRSNPSFSEKFQDPPARQPNGIEALGQRVQAGQISAFWPLTMAFLRLPLILAGHFLTFAVFVAAGDPRPWESAVSMTNFYLPLTADLVCLLLLVYLVRREGVGLGSLLGIERKRIGRDILLGLGLLLVTLVLFQLSSIVGALVAYGPALFTTPVQASSEGFVTPPLWVFWWSTLVLPVTVGIVEELNYRGYVQPRLQALWGKPWAAVLVMALGFGAQHLALPLVDWRTSLSRFIGTFLIGLFFGLVYQKQKRLLPLIIAHWGLDFLGLGLLPLLMVL